MFVYISTFWSHLIQSLLDYEQQRLHLLHKYGIDLEESNGIMNGIKKKRMDRKEADLLMGNGDGPDGIFTWREKNSRKVSYDQNIQFPFSTSELPVQ